MHGQLDGLPAHVFSSLLVVARGERGGWEGTRGDQGCVHRVGVSVCASCRPPDHVTVMWRPLLACVVLRWLVLCCAGLGWRGATGLINELWGVVCIEAQVGQALVLRVRPGRCVVCVASAEFDGLSLLGEGATPPPLLFLPLFCKVGAVND